MLHRQTTKQFKLQKKYFGQLFISVNNNRLAKVWARVQLPNPLYACFYVLVDL